MKHLTDKQVEIVEQNFPMLVEMVERVSGGKKKEDAQVVMRLTNLLESVQAGVDLAIIYVVENGFKFTIIPDEEFEEMKKTAHEIVVEADFNGRKH